MPEKSIGVIFRQEMGGFSVMNGNRIFTPIEQFLRMPEDFLFLFMDPQTRKQIFAVSFPASGKINTGRPISFGKIRRAEPEFRTII